MSFTIHVHHQDSIHEVLADYGQTYLQILRNNNFVVDSPCSGCGTCGRCWVEINGQEELACQLTAEPEAIVILP